MSMEKFLADLRLHNLKKIFKEEHITLDILLDLDTGELRETLKELGLRTGHRLKLMRAIKRMKNKMQQQG